MHYLTVQDVLWINLQVTKRTQSFNYAKLEEATFYQYGYGQSSSVLSQAGRFLSGFFAKRPFASGNEATALVACLAFLRLNGYAANLSDDVAVHWLERSSRDSTAATEALTGIVQEDKEFADEMEVDVRDAVHEVMDGLPKTLSLISRGMPAMMA